MMKNNFLFKKLFFIIFIFFLFSLPKFVWADTVIDKDLDITTDTVWAKEGGPYLISGYVSIESGATLKIESGTQIEFQNKSLDFELYGGNLDIEGTEGEKVNISASLGSDWNIYNYGGKITIKNANFSDIGTIDIENQGYADIKETEIPLIGSIYLFDQSFLSIDGGSLFSETSSALNLLESSTCYLSNLEVSGGPVAKFGRGSVMVIDSDLHVNNVIFDYSINTALVAWGGNINILNSQFDGGLSDGIDINYDFFENRIPSLNISNSNISNFKGPAVRSYEANVTIKESDIISNKVGFTIYTDNFNGIPSQSFVARKNNIVDNDVGVLFYLDNKTSNIIDVVNNYWGDASGPYDPGGTNPVFNGNPLGLGDKISSYFDITSFYIPWLLSPATHVKHNPVIIIPGILSSYLNKEDGTEVWPNLFKAFSSREDSYLDDLILNYDGRNSSTTINISDIMREIKIPYVEEVDFFHGLITKLKEQYSEGDDLFVFPYDWRFDVGTTAEEKLSVFVEDILKKTGSEKVDIIAHSMGGLVTKSYIKTFSGNKIGKFIDIATPHLGAPSAFKTLSFGDDLGIKWGLLGLNSDEIKKISQNMSSLYELLPSEKYFDSTNSDYKYYFDDLGDTDKNGVKGKLNFPETTDFLKNSRRNSSLLDQAKTFHEGIADVDPRADGIETINIVGCGTPTIGKIFTLDKKNSKNEYALGYISGDGTVPLRSAEGMNAGKTYYISGGVEHGTMPSSLNVKDIVSSVLFGKDISFSTNVSTTSENCKLPNGKYVSIHSPIKIDVYDGEGNHSGPNEFGDIEQNISGVIYDTIEDNKFVFIPDGKNYKINLQATDVGSFSVDIKTSKNGIDSFDYFNNIPIESVDLSGNIDLSSSTPVLAIKKDAKSIGEKLLSDISSDVDLNEKETDLPIQEISTSSESLFHNQVTHHSNGNMQNLLVTSSSSINPISEVISQEVNEKNISISDTTQNTESEISVNIKPITLSTSTLKKVDSSNFAGVLSGVNSFRGWNLLESLRDFKNLVWNFFLKIFHFIK